VVDIVKDDTEEGCLKGSAFVAHGNCCYCCPNDKSTVSNAVATSVLDLSADDDISSIQSANDDQGDTGLTESSARWLNFCECCLLASEQNQMCVLCEHFACKSSLVKKNEDQMLLNHATPTDQACGLPQHDHCHMKEKATEHELCIVLMANDSIF